MSDQELGPASGESLLGATDVLFEVGWLELGCWAWDMLLGMKSL